MPLAESILADIPRVPITGLTKEKAHGVRFALKEIQATMYSSPRAAVDVANEAARVDGLPGSVVGVLQLRAAQGLAFLAEFKPSIAALAAAETSFQKDSYGRAAVELTRAFVLNESWHREQAITAVQNARLLAQKIPQGPKRSYVSRATEFWMHALRYARTSTREFDATKSLYGDLTREVVERDPDPWGAAVMQYSIGKLNYHHHHYPEANGAFVRAMALAKDTGNLNLLEKARVFTAKVRYKEGDYAGARAALSLARPHFVEAQYYRGQIVASALCARVAIACYQFTDAQDEINRVQTLVSEHFPHVADEFGNVQVLKARLAYRSGRAIQAFHMLTEAPRGSLQRELNDDIVRYRDLAGIELGIRPPLPPLPPDGGLAGGEGSEGRLHSAREYGDAALKALRLGDMDLFRAYVMHSMGYVSVSQVEAWRACLGGHIGALKCRSASASLQEKEPNISAAIAWLEQSLIAYQAAVPVAGAFVRHRARTAFMLLLTGLLGNDTRLAAEAADTCASLIPQFNDSPDPTYETVMGLFLELERTFGDVRVLCLRLEAIVFAAGQALSPPWTAAGTNLLAVVERVADDRYSNARQVQECCDAIEMILGKEERGLPPSAIASSLGEESSREKVDRALGFLLNTRVVMSLGGGRLGLRIPTAAERGALTRVLRADSARHWELLLSIGTSTDDVEQDDPVDADE